MPSISVMRIAMTAMMSPVYFGFRGSSIRPLLSIRVDGAYLEIWIQNLHPRLNKGIVSPEISASGSPC